MSLCLGQDILRTRCLEDNQPVDSDFVRDYKETFIKVKEWGAFNDYDIQGNGLRSHRRETQPPEFVADFERKLLSKPRLAPDVCDYSFDAVRADGSV